VSPWIMHRRPAEGRTIWGRGFTARRYWPPIALSIVKGMIDVAVKATGAVIPGPSTDENAA
jgi:hypothetical protein